MKKERASWRAGKGEKMRNCVIWKAQKAEEMYVERIWATRLSPGGETAEEMNLAFCWKFGREASCDFKCAVRFLAEKIPVCQIELVDGELRFAFAYAARGAMAALPLIEYASCPYEIEAIRIELVDVEGNHRVVRLQRQAEMEYQIEAFDPSQVVWRRPIGKFQVEYQYTFDVPVEPEVLSGEAKFCREVNNYTVADVSLRQSMPDYDDSNNGAHILSENVQNWPVRLTIVSGSEAFERFVQSGMRDNAWKLRVVTANIECLDMLFCDPCGETGVVQLGLCPDPAGYFGMKPVTTEWMMLLRCDKKTYRLHVKVISIPYGDKMPIAYSVKLGECVAVKTKSTEPTPKVSKIADLGVEESEQSERREMDIRVVKHLSFGERARRAWNILVGKTV